MNYGAAKLAMDSLIAALAIAAAVLHVGAAYADAPAPASLSPDALSRIGAAHDVVLSRAESLERVVLDNRQAVLDSLRAVSGPSSDAIAIGWVSHAALVALRDPQFTTGVRRAAAHYGSAAVARGLRLDPGYVAKLPGAKRAKARVLAAARQDGETLRNAAARVKSQAQAMRKDATLTARRANARAALAALDADTAPTPALTPIHASSLRQRVASAPSPARSGVPALFAIATASTGGAKTNYDRRRSHDAAIDQALTLAALITLDAATAQDVAAAAPRGVRRCAVMARLQTKACIAAARASHEDAYCLARHGLGDMASCLDGAR